MDAVWYAKQVSTKERIVSKWEFPKERKENYMKKKMMAALLAGMMILAAGCGNKTGAVTLGEYKGMALTNVTQETLDAEVQAMLEYYTELVETDRAAVEGDTVNINYTGLLDGVAFEGGTDDSEAGTDLKLGSGQFIPGFEDGLIGAVAGEQRDLDLTFPDPYQNNPDLAGKAVVFQVTVNAVKEEKVPELNEEFLAKAAPDYDTVDELLTALRETLNQDSHYDQITTNLMESCEVTKYNEADVAERKERLIAEYTSYAEYYGSYYGFDTETSIIYFLGFESVEAFEEEMGNYAYDVEKNAMIMDAIAKQENITVSEEEYNADVEKLASYYGYEDVATFEEDNGKDLIIQTMLSEKVMTFIIENAVISDAE